MGYTKHEAIIVTGVNEIHATNARAIAAFIFGNKLVSPLIMSPVNGYFSFFVSPDGSKEGRDEATAYEKKRGDFRDWLRHNPDVCCNAVMVRYGGDDESIETELYTVY